MNGRQLLLLDASIAALALTLLGLAIQRRLSIAWVFAAYLLAVLSWDVLIRYWPSTFWHASGWIVASGCFAALRFGVAVEVALVTFRHLPRARAQALGLLILIVGLASVCAPWGAPTDVAAVGIVAPRLHTASLCALAGVAAVAARHRLALLPLHRDVLLGFGLYLAVYGLLLAGIGSAGASRPEYMRAWELFNAWDPLVYFASVGIWFWAAWRPEPALSTQLERLRPWATSR